MTEVNQDTIHKSELYVYIMELLKDNRKKEASQLIWPWIEPNEWRDKIYEHLESNSHCAIMGHGSAAKTFTSCEWFLLDWWSDPQNTALMITSDTIPAMERRVWSDMKRLWSQTSVPMPGILVDSKRMILYSHLDRKNAIAGVAAEDKDSQTKIQGLHTKRVRVIIDEADNKDSQSVWKAISNLETSGELKVVALANPSNRMSEFGRHCEPVGGWGSEIGMKWVSKAGWSILRLNGLDSPNLKAGYDKFPFLLTNKAVESIRTKLGTNHMEWFSFVLGTYSPLGDTRTIFPPDILVNCRKQIVWYADTEPIASCDPALEEGGDSCVLTLGRMGRLASDYKKTGIQVQRMFPIKQLDMTKPPTIDKGDQIIGHLKAHGVEPDHFSIDCTGEGRGISDYIKYAWQPGKTVPTLDVRFGGSPTELTLTTEDTKPASERFDRFVSELWYVSREWCRLGLVWVPDGVGDDLPRDLESRLYELLGSKQMISIESKKAMKKRGLKSPDYGDAFCLLIHLARSLASSTGFKPGIFAKPKGLSVIDRLKRNQAYVGNPTYGVA